MMILLKNNTTLWADKGDTIIKDTHDATALQQILRYLNAVKDVLPGAPQQNHEGHSKHSEIHGSMQINDEWICAFNEMFYNWAIGQSRLYLDGIFRGNSRSWKVLLLEQGYWRWSVSSPKRSSHLEVWCDSFTSIVARWSAEAPFSNRWIKFQIMNWHLALCSEEDECFGAGCFSAMSLRPARKNGVMAPGTSAWWCDRRSP